MEHAVGPQCHRPRPASLSQANRLSLFRSENTTLFSRCSLNTVVIVAELNSG